MSEPQIAPYGKWASPITAGHLSSGSVHLEGIQANPSTGQIYALESRPAEGGRHAIVEILASTSTSPSTRDVLPAGYNAMGAIHEYGGGSFLVYPDEGTVLFTDYPRNGIFSLNPRSGEVTTIVPPNPHIRYGNFHVYPRRHEWILAVRETHGPRGADENSVVAIHALTGEVSTVAQGADFYQHPQFSPDGRYVSWIQWNHPDMPWTGSVLHVAVWEARTVLTDMETIVVAGQPGAESICQPRWGPDGTLFFVSDRSGFWQLYRWEATGSGTGVEIEGEVKMIELKGLECAEFGSREPCLGNCTYVLLDENTLVASAVQNATANLVKIDLRTDTWEDLDLPLVDIQKNALAPLSPTSFVVIGSTRTSSQALYQVDLANDTNLTLNLIYTTSTNPLPASLISPATHITFPRIHSQSHSTSKPLPMHAHAVFNPPLNPSYTGTPNTLPPLLLWMHGGPTTHVPPSLALSVQYWTSRGYAYASLNHIGSTGYGRAYRSALNRHWGVEDIADAASCVAYLAEQKLIDKNRVGIVGESAGGYAVLQALTTYPDLWAAGISLYGISDLAAFARITHKFESRYIVSLVLGFEGETWSEEKREEVYRSRSAVYFADRVKAPLLLLQGDADTIVPLEQAVQMRDVLREKGKSVEMVVFEGEGHGWAKGETIKRSLELEEEFWGRMLL
ncbi:Alpha/Beta hydrolase protein [Aspergillus pseudodeflectus]|uniref:Alpha/Beta hydrolase protein n=1 Tax=Aspergillus pseudodeflectus TaxID=176178 RepID=A0ABR4KV70_9EURO